MKTTIRPSRDSSATVSFALALCMLLLAFGSFCYITQCTTFFGGCFWFVSALAQLLLAVGFATEAVVRK